MDSAQCRDLAPFFGDFRQSKKLSRIQPPLNMYVLKMNLCSQLTILDRTWTTNSLIHVCLEMCMKRDSENSCGSKVTQIRSLCIFHLLGLPRTIHINFSIQMENANKISMYLYIKVNTFGLPT